MQDKEEIMQIILDFLSELDSAGKTYTGVLYTDTSLILSSKEKIIETAEELGVYVDQEMEDQDILVLAMDEEEESEGYLQ